jgi:hypothetical protein
MKTYPDGDFRKGKNYLFDRRFKQVRKGSGGGQVGGSEGVRVGVRRAKTTFSTADSIRFLTLTNRLVLH